MNEKNKGMSREEILEIQDEKLKISRMLVDARKATEEKVEKYLEKGLTLFEITTKYSIPVITVGEIKQDMGDCKGSRDYSNFLRVLRDRGIEIEDNWKWWLQFFGGYDDREVIANVPDELAFRIVKWEQPTGGE